MINIVEKIAKDFKQLAQSGNLFHAYLFFGDQIDEIFSFAKKIANLLETGEFKEPGKFLNDFLAIEPNEFGNIGIDQIRDLQYFLFQKPAVSKRRVAIILGADAMSDESTGAVLKIIEEPPQKTLIILIGYREDSLPQTVLSRVHKFYFPVACASPAASARRVGKTSPSVSSGRRKEKTGKETEDLDAVFKNILLDLEKNLGDNVFAAKEILERISLIKRYNLNNRLQLRVINYIIKNQKVKK